MIKSVSKFHIFITVIAVALAFSAPHLASAAGLPTVYTGSAAGIGSNAAILNGTVDPNGAATDYWFEYGINSNLGETPGLQSMNSDAGIRNISFPISGLFPGANYSFRLVARNSYGTSFGSVVTFTTNAGGYPAGNYYGSGYSDGVGCYGCGYYSSGYSGGVGYYGGAYYVSGYGGGYSTGYYGQAPQSQSARPYVAYNPPAQTSPTKPSGSVLGTQSQSAPVVAQKTASESESAAVSETSGYTNSSKSGLASLLSVFGGWGWVWLLIILSVTGTAYWIFFGKEDKKKTAREKIEQSLA